MAYKPLNLVSESSKRYITLWGKKEQEELRLLSYHRSQGYAMLGIYKLYDPNNTDKRTDMDGPWKICCNGYVITTKTTESAADTFIRKMKDALNTHEGSNTLKLIQDI